VMSNTFVNPMDYAQGRNDKPFKYSFLENERMLLGMNCLQSGQQQPLHDHATQDKFYYVVSGEGWFTVGDEARACTAGELVICPAGVPHGVENRAEALLTILTVIAPWR
jgi:quercetin dioxygenase-like cupin family protein